MEQKYRSFLAETRSYNAQEGTPEQFTNDTFLNVRR